MTDEEYRSRRKALDREREELDRRRALDKEKEELDSLEDEYKAKSTAFRDEHRRGVEAKRGDKYTGLHESHKKYGHRKAIRVMGYADGCWNGPDSVLDRTYVFFADRKCYYCVLDVSVPVVDMNGIRDSVENHTCHPCGEYLLDWIMEHGVDLSHYTGVPEYSDDGLGW
jgi:hypothetical protein